MSDRHLRRRPAAAAPVVSTDSSAPTAADASPVNLLLGLLGQAEPAPALSEGGEAPAATTGDEAPDTVRSALAKAAWLRKQMDAVDKEIMDEIRRVEDLMRGHFNTRTSVELSSGDDWAEFLAFGKHDGRWQLLIVVGTLDDEPDTRPLLAHGREKRAEVVAGGYIRKLVMRAAEQYEREMSERVAGLSDLRRLGAELASAGKAGV